MTNCIENGKKQIADKNDNESSRTWVVVDAAAKEGCSCNAVNCIGGYISKCNKMQLGRDIRG